MIILEKLYDCAQQHLGTEQKNWAAFADNFLSIFKAHVSLYRVAFGSTGTTPTTFEIIATSNQAFMSEYVERRMYELHPFPETTLAPLVPVRRSDDLNDEEFKNLGELAEYLIANGSFFTIMVPAILPDNSFLGLYVWRTEAEGDFDDTEMQRLALFMRHLMVLVDVKSLIPFNPKTPKNTTSSMATFGARHGLTDAEIQVLTALLSGHAPRSIAKQTKRTYGTVRWHIQNILQKCGVGSQRELLRAFFQSQA